MFKEELRVLYHLCLNTNGFILSLAPSSLFCVWFQDSKYDHHALKGCRVAYILLDSESTAEEGTEYWLWSDSFVYVNC